MLTTLHQTPQRIRRGLRRLNPRDKFLLLAGAAFFLFLLPVVMAYNSATERMVDRQGVRLAQKLAQYDKERVLKPLAFELTRVRNMAQSAVLRDWARNEHDPKLYRAAMAELERFRLGTLGQNYSVTLAQSQNYHSHDPESPKAPGTYKLDPGNPKDAWFFAALGNPQDHELLVGTDRHFGLTKVWINVVMLDGDRPLGILSTGLDLDHFSNHVAATAQPGVGQLLVNREAAVQIDRALPHDPDSANTTQTLQQQRSLDSLLDQPADGQWLRTAIDRLTGDPALPIPTRHVQVGGKPYIAAIATLPTLRWYSVSLLDPALLIPRRELLEMRALFGVSALGCLVILALMLRAFFLKGRLARQLDRQSQQFADTQTILEDALALERGTRTTQTNMVHTVAHEFRGTLATIGNTTQMLQVLAQSPEPVEPGRLQPRLDKMLRSVRHLSQLLSDLLGDNRMATSAAQLHLRTGSLNPFCEALAARLAKDHGRPIQWEPGPLPGELMIDWSLLGVAIGNLVDNAIKYAPAGSPILLHTGLANPDRLFVAVSDSGPGIAPEFQHKVFEKSARLDAASAVPGTGMGLYLVNWIAELHGGSAAVVSASGQGSTFTIYLPRP